MKKIITLLVIFLICPALAQASSWGYKPKAPKKNHWAVFLNQVKKQRVNRINRIKRIKRIKRPDPHKTYNAIVKKIESYDIENADAKKIVANCNLLYNGLASSEVLTGDVTLPSAIETWFKQGDKLFNNLVIQVAWECTAEWYLFDFANGGKSTAEIFAELQKLGDMPLTQTNDLIPSSCDEESSFVEEGCGLSNTDLPSNNPFPIDPSPMAYSSSFNSSFSIPAGATPVMASQNHMSPCYGINPKYLGNNAADPAPKDDKKPPPPKDDKKPPPPKDDKNPPPKDDKNPPPKDDSTGNPVDKAFSALDNLTTIPAGDGTIKVGSTIQTLVNLFRSGGIGLGVGGTFMPGPTSDVTPDSCGDDFAAHIAYVAGCTGIGANMSSNQFFCGLDALAPVMPSPDSPPAMCGCDGGEGVDDGSENDDDSVGGLPCCPEHCKVADSEGSEGCNYDECNPACGGGGGGGGGGKKHPCNDPGIAQANPNGCYVIDPSPIEAQSQVQTGQPMGMYGYHGLVQNDPQMNP